MTPPTMFTVQLSSEELKTIYFAVRQHQINKCILNGKEYSLCSGILDKAFPLVYTQTQEQPT